MIATKPGWHDLLDAKWISMIINVLFEFTMINPDQTHLLNNSDCIMFRPDHI